jgi:hypothetical protein
LNRSDSSKLEIDPDSDHSIEAAQELLAKASKACQANGKVIPFSDLSSLLPAPSWRAGRRLIIDLARAVLGSALLPTTGIEAAEGVAAPGSNN